VSDISGVDLRAMGIVRSIVAEDWPAVAQLIRIEPSKDDLIVGLAILARYLSREGGLDDRLVELHKFAIGRVHLAQDAEQ